MTSFLRTSIATAALLCAIVLVADDTNETPQIPTSFEEAKTLEEVYAFLKPHTEKYLAVYANPNRTKEDEKKNRLDYAPAALAAGDRIIALSTNDPTLKEGYQLKIIAWNCLVIENPELMTKKEALIDEITKLDKFPDLVNDHQFFLFHRRLLEIGESAVSKEDFESLKEDAKKLATLSSTYNAIWPMEKVLETAKKMDVKNNLQDFLDSTLEELIEFGLTNEQCIITSEDIQKLRGFSRRLVGSSFELYGKTVNGDDFSWDDYKDKIVLIEFTASWCGPCRAEMPNLLEIYKLYHDKGLEIVAVGIRDTTENLKKQIEDDQIPWQMISEELSQNTLDHELPSDHYGVYGIPEIFLVGKDGKIIATRLFGQKLRFQMDELFDNK